jgi:hypothetical protein
MKEMFPSCERRSLHTILNEVIQNVFFFYISHIIQGTTGQRLTVQVGSSVCYIYPAVWRVEMDGIPPYRSY